MGLQVSEIKKVLGADPVPFHFHDAQRRTRAARNGLIASASMFSFGWIFLGVAIPRCQSTTDGLLNCTNPGYSCLAVGLTFTFSGAVGMLVSGALLGARKKNQRVLESGIQQRWGGASDGTSSGERSCSSRVGKMNPNTPQPSVRPAQDFNVS